MKATEMKGKRKWRQSLAKRTYLSLFRLPFFIVINCKVVSNTKRSVLIDLSDGRKILGLATITSGTEIYIPTRFHKDLQSCEWFECEILDDTLYVESSLKWLR